MIAGLAQELHPFKTLARCARTRVAFVGAALRPVVSAAMAATVFPIAMGAIGAERTFAAVTLVSVAGMPMLSAIVGVAPMLICGAVLILAPAIRMIPAVRTLFAVRAAVVPGARALLEGIVGAGLSALITAVRTVRITTTVACVLATSVRAAATARILTGSVPVVVTCFTAAVLACFATAIRACFATTILTCFATARIAVAVASR